MNSQKLTDKDNDFRTVFEALRGLAAELWDAAERLEASYGMVCDALNDTMNDDECMFVLCTRPGVFREAAAAAAAAIAAAKEAQNAA